MKNSEIAIKLNSIRIGDKTAFEELYNNLKTPVYTIIHRVTWDSTMSEDILQEVFLKLWSAPPAPSVENPRAYIFRMARNSAIDSARKRKLSLSLDEIEDSLPAPSLDLTLRMDIESALKTLPGEECQIVTLHVIGEMKFREISEIMKIPLGTALWKYQKAIGKLRKQLGG